MAADTKTSHHYMEKFIAKLGGIVLRVHYAKVSNFSPKRNFGQSEKILLSRGLAGLQKFEQIYRARHYSGF